MRLRSAAVAMLLVGLATTPALAQTTAPTTTQPAPARDDHRFDWGLLGLLGLAGLAPLFTRKDTRTHSVDATNR